MQAVSWTESFSLLQSLKSSREVVKVHVSPSPSSRTSTVGAREGGVRDRGQVQCRWAYTLCPGQGRRLHSYLGTSGLNREREREEGGGGGGVGEGRMKSASV